MTGFDSLLIEEQRKVRDALHQLEETRRQILYVIDDASRLVGSLTDGDVRRWILGGGDLDSGVGNVCNREPHSVSDGYSLAVLRHDMSTYKLHSLPVVNAQGTIVDVLFRERVFEEAERQAQKAPLAMPVVVMAGGKGTRLAPFTSVLPKPLIPVGEKTAIEVILDAFVAHGVDDFYLSVNYKSKLIQAYFEELDPPYRLSYVHEDQPLGTGGGLHALIGKFDGDLIVTNCDVIIKADYHDLVEHHRREDNDITMVVSLRHYDIPYGICDIVDNGQLCSMREKPHYNFLVNTGLYVLQASVLELIPENQFYHLTDLIDDVKTRGGRVGVYPISEKAWLDTGEWQQYCDTMAQLRS
ncbi:nucleotidyltransferase family protein [Aidingimonas halophila]|uniref:CBS domain-containing protein n=1 Tax=Aidingimonas halophila TaxID=574349 RepID=A0A1H3CJ06_9GAMM|nr:nucleotidyltransferase family protein [Aidingimonas halophila]GHC35457.1 mannose-1-phosphate guanylyltransferase [Aidingimonas halophila]SDX53574.1 CBS domain-containing protein [Aidingimonas halophila]